MCRVLGVDAAVLTGGLMNRSALWRSLRGAFEHEGIGCWRATDPDLSAAMGALPAGPEWGRLARASAEAASVEAFDRSTTEGPGSRHA